MSDGGVKEIPVPDGIDVGKALALANWIVTQEADNEKTQRLSDTQMVNRLASKIQSEVR